MKKIDLPLRELLQFPTLLQIRLFFLDDDLDEVGICHKNGEALTVARASDEWRIIKPLTSILEDVSKQYGQESDERDRNIIVHFSITPPDIVSSPNAQHILRVNYIDISHHREMIVLPKPPPLFN